MVGNGVTTWEFDTLPAYVEMAYWFGLYDDDLYWKIKNNCNLGYADFDPISEECN
jgi:hypothetical protein